MALNDDTASPRTPALNYHIYAAREEALALAIGRAVARWANLEAQVILICATSLGFDARDASSVISSFKSFALILDFTDKTVKSRIKEKDAQRRWNSIYEYVREISGDRNYIAHQGMVAHGPGNPEEADWSLAEPKVGPSITTHFADKATREPMDTSEVIEICLDIQECVELLMGFNADFGNGPSWPKTFYEPIRRRRPSVSQRRVQAGKA